MQRRDFLGASATGLAGVTAGCSGILGDDSARVPQALADPPDAIYVPTHMEGMAMAGMGGSGRYRFALAYSFPHRFWQVTGGERRTVEVREGEDLHLMCTVWDEETGTVIPSSDVPVTVRRDGESVDSRTMWLMLSQNMGVHFGDNVPLEGAGTYEVELDFGPVGSRVLGDFHGDLGGSAAVSLDLAYDPDDLEDLAFEEFEDRAGERDAIEPMDMEMMPTATTPAPEDLPGQYVGSGTVGDATFEVTLLPEAPTGIDEAGQYLAVSARTPYNEYPIPRLSVSAAVGDSGDAKLAAAIHPSLGFHYGAVFGDVSADEDVTVIVNSPSTVARHEGYETAFMETGSVTV